ncbi:DUF1289 domain-containing protein [Aquincola sp. J276]|uniref:DUF1289 domain-containing protein n=1 Tax=Aquincola sp. J276 TaxID=2898432 RepID=UPI002150CE1E|nr:DUF1289 domain-containing protein [Aquincola sp. J276]MCR5865563.1 DUF1289 domain-containing protein [Aquincola sp. J276]
MTRTPAPATAVASPCINVCQMHASTGWCIGCGRTLDEIAAWSRLDDGGKRAVWTLLPPRMARLRQLKVQERKARP